MSKPTRHDMAACMLSIYDSLKLQDTREPGDVVDPGETLTEMMFRKMKAYNVDLNAELGFDHLKPVPFDEEVHGPRYGLDIQPN